MSLNQSELVKFVEDLRYVVQAGGDGFVQSGGSAAQNLKTGMQLFMMMLKVIVYIVIAYILYVFWFKGYPKFLLDLGTLSFFKRENLDRMFEEHFFLLNHYKYFMKQPHEIKGASPGDLYSKIISKTNLSSAMDDLDTFIKVQYSEFKFDKKYVRAFADFYLLFNTVMSPLDSPGAKQKLASTLGGYGEKISVWPEQLADPSWTPPPYNKSDRKTHKYWEPATNIEKHLSSPNQESLVDQAKMVPRAPPEYFIDNARFYGMYAEILNRLAVSQERRANREGKKTERLRTAELQFQDKRKGSPLLQKIIDLKTMFIGIQQECRKQRNALIDNGSSYFITILDDPAMSSKVASEIVNNYAYLNDNTLYKKPATDLSDYSWYLFEVMTAVNSGINADKIDEITAIKNQIKDLQSMKNPRANARIISNLQVRMRGIEKELEPLTNVYNSLAGQLESFLSGKPFETRIILTAYLALPKNRKQYVKSTLLINYPHIDITQDMLHFLHKYPIFSSIYLNTKVDTTNKLSVWRNTMKAYYFLMRTNKTDPIPLDLTNVNDIPKACANLVENGRVFKQYVNSIFVLDMFLNDFQNQMTQLYEQQFRSNVRFFKELWDPYYQQIVELRVAPYFRRMLSVSNMARSFYNFWQLWKVVGRMIQRLKREIGAAFRRGVTMPSDPPPT